MRAQSYQGLIVDHLLDSLKIIQNTVEGSAFVIFTACEQSSIHQLVSACEHEYEYIVDLPESVLIDLHLPEDALTVM